MYRIINATNAKIPITAPTEPPTNERENILCMQATAYKAQHWTNEYATRQRFHSHRKIIIFFIFSGDSFSLSSSHFIRSIILHSLY